MIRRVAFAVCALLAVASLSSCSTFRAVDSVAVVNGHELSKDGFSTIVNSQLGKDAFKAAPQNGQVSMEFAESLITLWVQVEALGQSDVVDLTPTAAEQQATAAAYPNSWASAPDTVKQMVTRLDVLKNVIQSKTAPTADLIAAIKDAKIKISSRYGYWDSSQVRVQPFR
ncbi:MAG: hypothetical protein ABIQ39_17270 [Ilumatobacteraceae bacterium]